MYNTDNSINIKWEVLSALRFLLAFIVACNHLIAYTDIGFLKYFYYLGPFEAILGFLLISGYSIGTSIQRNPQNFMFRRAKRIYPVYIASILLTFLFKMDVIDLNFIFIIIINLLFLNQLVIETSYVGGAWSLSLEMWLYFCAGWINKLTHNKQWLLVGISFIAYIVYTCLRTLMDMPYYSGTNFGLNILVLSFIWIAGFNLAKFKAFYTASINKVGALFLMHLGLITSIQLAYQYKNQNITAFFQEDLIQYIFHLILLVIIFSAFKFSHSKLKISDTLKSFLDFIGNISYPLYLCHTPTYHICRKYGIEHPAIYLIAAFIISTLVYLIFDFYTKKRISK